MDVTEEEMVVVVRPVQPLKAPPLIDATPSRTVTALTLTLPCSESPV